MKKMMVVLMAAVVMSFSAISATASSEDDVAVNAIFTVQFHDIAVMIMLPKAERSSTIDHPVISGCHVTVVLSKNYELVAPPQCHWDGINEKSRYSYTLYYRLSGDKSDLVISYSLNLNEFKSIYNGEKSLKITSVSVVPNDNIVYFETADFRKISAGADAQKFVMNTEK